MQKKVNILNKKAKFQYEILDKYSAGIVLSGTEKVWANGKKLTKELVTNIINQN